MLSRFSVKKPYIIVVAVIICLILGGVSLTKMKTDLIPDMDLPYLAVITTDPGASAEKVESEVTDVLEGSLSTISGVKSVTSTSADNYSMIFLSFEDGTDMDSALVKVSSAANEVSSQLPDTAGNPNFMEISADMMATMYVATAYDGKDIYELSDFIDETVVPALQRVDGVADVSTVGSVERTVEVRLDDDKIEQINNKLLASVNDQLYEAKAQIDSGKAALEDAENQLAEQEAALNQQQSSTDDELGSALSGLTLAVSAQTAQVSSIAADLQAAIAAGDMTKAAQLQAQLTEAQATLDQYQSQMSQAESGALSAAAGFGSGTAQLAAAKTQLESSKSELEEAEAQYESSRETAIASANIDSLVEKSTLAQLLTAQNFSMPAGYLDSNDDNQWLLRVGTELSSVDDLRNLLLCNIDGVGDIRVDDVAEVTVVDNVGDAYMKLNNKEGVMLSIFKSSTANTSDVSHACSEAMTTLTDKYPGLTLSIVSDQGQYIDLFISSILRSLLLGALLAVVVLAVFLRDWKPTVIVAFSIPFSVLVALVIMYFSGITLNIMTMGGISVAIGMLVDNSIIVLENIYRLRARGIPAARAAVQGAKQITGAVVASTLTTICVFIPIVFTTGIVNQLMLPFALTIAYVLTASLLIALTLVPTLSSIIFRKQRAHKYGWFEKLQDGYAKALDFFLRHKVLPLGIAAVLLVVSIAGVINMGVTMIPSMTSKTIDADIVLAEDTTKEEAYKTADAVMEAALSIDGVEDVGAMDGSATVSLVSSSFSGSDSDAMHTSFSFYMTTDDSITSEAQIYDICEQLKEKTSNLQIEEMITDEDSSSSMSSMLGSGLTLYVKGDDNDKLVKVSEDLMAIVDSVEGYTEIENGLEDADTEVILNIDKDKLTKEGYTVAQLYSDLSSRLSTSADSTSLDLDGISTQIQVVDENHLINVDNLLDTEIDIKNSTTGDTNTIKLGDVATVQMSKAADTIGHSNGVRYMTISAEVEDGYNNALLSRELKEKLADYDMPEGFSYSISGEISNIDTMLEQMMLLLIVGFVLIYLVMVAQFQSLLSPFIILFTVPLAFTGGFLGLLAGGEQLSMLSLMGFAVLMGTVVNNGIVFVDFVNQLRRGGLLKRDSLIATGRMRMRPILMTALTTILAMLPMILSTDVGASMERGMALVVVGGLLYATFMTLFIVPIMYDLLYRKVPKEVNIGDESIDEDVNDAQAYLESLRGRHAAPEGGAGSMAVAPVAPAGAGAGANASSAGSGFVGLGETRKRADFTIPRGIPEIDASADISTQKTLKFPRIRK